MSKINFKPTRDWVVLPLQRKNKTEAGIHISESTANALRTNVLEVLAAGPMCEMIKEGDTVMVHPSSEGLVVDIDKKQYVMVNEFQICGVFPE